MNKKKFLRIFEMAIESEDITEIIIKVRQPIGGYETITFNRERFNEKYEYYKNNYDDDMRLKSFRHTYISEIDFTISK